MKQISIYQVEDIPIGSGGMGCVMKGYATNGTKVAIKEILPEFVTDMEYRSRIDREIGFLQKLNSDKIVKIYDHFQIGNNLYIVMELVEGLNIEQYVEKNGPIPEEEAVNMMDQILQTVQYVHEQGIIHRDIKPSNIMIRPNKEICLLDFGIAKDVNTSGGTLLGTILGTDGYMSPEQADGMSIDHRSDIYSLACVFFFMLTGHHAYKKEASEVQTKLNIVNNPFPRINKYKKGITAGIQDVMDHATDKNMLKRYQSCREFRTELMKVARRGTQLNSNSSEQGVSVSIGRENCDICVASDNYKVSRHHADVKFRSFTGGAFYVYTDCSSNGTKIDGQMYTKGMSCNIQKGKVPAIYLAGDPSCRLNWEEVCQLVDEKVRQLQGEQQPEEQSLKTVELSREDVKEILHTSNVNRNVDFLGAIKICFTKYAVFKGRASRSEYWWFYLFQVIMSLLFYLLQFISPKLSFMSIIYSLAVIIPNLAVTSRRFHDIGKSFANYLFYVFGGLISVIVSMGIMYGLSIVAGAIAIVILPLIIFFLFIYEMAKKGTGPNRFD
jgi:serine/threonine-protein kinase